MSELEYAGNGKFVKPINSYDLDGSIASLYVYAQILNGIIFDFSKSEDVTINRLNEMLMLIYLNILQQIYQSYAALVIMKWTIWKINVLLQLDDNTVHLSIGETYNGNIGKIIHFVNTYKTNVINKRNYLMNGGN